MIPHPFDGTTVRNLRKAVSETSVIPSRYNKWLSKHSPSAAILQCLGSGPWKYKRRYNVQLKALQTLGTADIAQLSKHTVETVFPLEWQTAMLLTLWENLHEHKCLFNDVGSRKCCTRANLASMFNRELLPKVLAMYVRDYLCSRAFPIDRHVRAWLKTYQLPLNEQDIIEACYRIGTDPCALNRGIFGKVSDNPEFPVDVNKLLMLEPVV